MQTHETSPPATAAALPAERLGTLLGVWAHPDDEAYLSAGLMATARAAGHRVVVATATRGEHGTADPGAWPPARLAGLRERELAESLAAVGVEEHHWLGHVDGTLDRVDPRAGAGQVAELLDRVRPDIVVTFGPDGMTGHPDHRAVSAWVTDAWHRTGRVARLWYATLTPEFHARWGAVNDTAGLWPDPAAAPRTPGGELAHVVRCEGPMLTRKYEALRSHRSQTGNLIELVGEDVYRDWWAIEYFTTPGASRR
ncbi:PIG-L deacetylase family protein [Dactylosporangium sp. CA-139066]|uniref:PIG-L deacetylase family protein n=1 Tax=Dactylosporangium sp. CA-139066 TaxID=3239930 RepID=UPI003D946F9B